MNERPHWYMATDGRGGIRPYSVDIGPIEPHYINSLEKAVAALTSERDEAVRELEILRHERNVAASVRDEWARTAGEIEEERDQLQSERDEAVRESADLRRQLRWAWLNIGPGCRCIFDDEDNKITEDAHCYIHGVYVEKDQFREIDDSLTTDKAAQGRTGETMTNETGI